MKSRLFTVAMAALSFAAFPALAAEPDHARTPEAPLLINAEGLKWVKTIPDAGERSPEYAILHEDKVSGLTTLMFRTPVPVYIKPHTHDRAETHVVLKGGTHVFAAEGERYAIEKGGYLRMPGKVVHEAWLPAGSVTVNIEESGWLVNWLNGGPSIEDVGVTAPRSPAR